MKALLTFIAIIIIAFDFFMASPWGMFRIIERLDNDETSYEVIITFLSAIPLIIIIEILKNI